MTGANRADWGILRGRIPPPHEEKHPCHSKMMCRWGESRPLLRTEVRRPHPQGEQGRRQSPITERWRSSNWNGRAGPPRHRCRLSRPSHCPRPIAQPNPVRPRTPSSAAASEIDIGAKEGQLLSAELPLPAGNEAPEMVTRIPIERRGRVRVLEGLCFRIHDESLEGIPTRPPYLDAARCGPARNGLSRRRRGRLSTRTGEEAELIEGLNRLLPQPILYDEGFLRQAGGSPP